MSPLLYGHISQDDTHTYTHTQTQTYMGMIKFNKNP